MKYNSPLVELKRYELLNINLPTLNFLIFFLSSFNIRRSIFIIQFKRLTMKSKNPIIHNSMSERRRRAGITSLLILIISIFIFFSSCRNRVTPPDDTPKPGKRDYTWTIDTLAYPGSFQTLMRDIWASSPTNVYVVGHNDQGGQGTMFRFDGNRWRAVDLGSIIIGGISLSAIYGFGPNDIYAVGRRIYDNPTPPPNFLDSSLIIRFDGVSWSEVPIQRGRNLQTVHGDRPNNVWTGGIYGTAYRYDGVNCTRMNSESNLWFKDIEAISIQVYGLAYTPNPGNYTVHYLLQPDSNTWAVVDSFTEVSIASAKFGHEDLRMIGGTLYSVGFGVFRKDGADWTKIQETNTLLSIYGTRKGHIFTVGNFLNVWHFNGDNWSKLIVLGNPTWLLTSVWCDESEVFIVASDGYKTFIIHGC